MFLNFLKPQILFDSEGSSGGGGGGGSSSSSSSSSTSSTTKKKKKTTTTSKVGTDAGDGMVWAKSSNSNALVRVSKNKPKSSGGGRNLDADMAAGSGYAPTKNAGTSSARQVTYTRDTDGSKRKEVALTKKTPITSKTSVTAKDLKAGKVTTYKSKTGTGSVTVARGTKLKDVPTVNVGVNGKKTVSNAEAYSPVGNTPTPAPTVKSSSPVTAPEKIDPRDGVGGGRDGGGSAKRKQSDVQEDNLKVKRASEGVGAYKNRQKSSIRTAGEKRRKNPMAINKSRA